MTIGARGGAHPSRAAYSGGCRCDGCREANRVYIVRTRRARGVLPMIERYPEPPHGAARYGSRRWACRCAICRAGHAERMRDLWARQKASR